jgi:membrane associated rhomboid family serine protease
MVPVVGASGAAFGLLGAAIVMARRRGIDIWSSGLGPVLAINLALTFLVPGIAIGGHIGGVVGGFIAGFAMEEVSERSGKAAAIAVCSAIGIVAVAICIAAAGSGGLITGPTGL